MSIFKRIGSFASNSWREFCEYHETKEEHGKIACPAEENNNNSKTNLVEKRSAGNEENVIRRRSFQGLFHKRTSKKKLLEDPRSPSVAILRTPMPEAENNSFDQGILSPFNVKDMLETIETAVDSNDKPPAELKPASSCDAIEPKQEQEQHFITTDEIVDWKSFDYKGKAITDSLIVEVSSFDIKSTSFMEDGEKEKKEAFNVNNENIVVSGPAIKSPVEDAPGKAQAKLALMITSTPKKHVKDEQLDGGNGNTPRTPLMAISNSPLVCNKDINNKLVDNNKKKKLANNPKRRLPKAPATPMTPLVKSQQAMMVATADKENY